MAHSDVNLADRPGNLVESYKNYDPRIVFFYFLGFLMSAVGLVLGVFETVRRLGGHTITPATIVLVALLLISGSQFTLFAMWFDMESNKDLR